MSILSILFIVVVVIVGGYLSSRQMFFSERRYSPWLTGYWILKCFALSFLLVSTYHLLTSGLDARDSSTGGSVVFVVDVSTSMDVSDIDQGMKSVSRKSYIRTVLGEFVTTYPGYSYSVIVFADEARTLIPSTTDPNILLTFLGSLESFNSLPGGSNFDAAVGYTSDYLDRVETPSYVVMISDGGDEFVELDTTEGTSQYMTDMLVLGVGSEDGGYVPDGRDPFGRVIVKQYQGQPVTSKLNPQSLRTIAKQLGGEYTELKHISDMDGIISTLGVKQASGESPGSNTSAWMLAVGVLVYILIVYLPWGAMINKISLGKS